MKKITIIIVWALLCLNFASMAQSQTVINPLKIGDKLPDSFWQMQHQVYKNGDTTTSTLAAYKGKLLILVFWASWCGSCFHKFPFLDSVNQSQGNKLQVILVNSKKTGDDLAKVKVKLNAYRKDNPFQLATIYQDEYLKSLFPHYLLSHYVWINQEARVVAFTSADFANPQSIDHLLQKINDQ